MLRQAQREDAAVGAACRRRSKRSMGMLRQAQW
jgi:hypothetical protein